jgi:O-antigen/teichoic acid export membrane protein
MTLAPARPTRDPGTRAGIASVARGGLANLVGAAVAGVSGFAVTWLVARALGPSQAGAFFAATAAFLLASTVAKLGTQTGLVYFVARLRAGGATTGSLRDCLRMAIVPVVVAAVGCGIALWYAAPWLAAITARDGAHGYVAQLRVLALLLPVGVASDTLLAASRGWRTMRPTVVVDRILRPGAQVALLAGLAFATVTSPPAYTLGWALPYLSSALLAGYVLHRLLQLYRPSRPKPRPYGTPRQSTVDRKRFWRFTAPRALASVAQLAAQRVDVLLLASLAGLRAAAVYAVAGRFIVLGQFANQAISQAVQPRLAELLSTGDRPGAAALYRTATGWLVLAAWPLYLGIAVYPPVYLGLFGPGFKGAHRVVVVLALAMLVATGCGMVDMVLSMAGRTSWNLANVVTALGVNLGVDLLLIPRLGALGAAIGLAAATLTNNLVPLAQIAVVLRLHPFGRGTLAAAALALCCFGAIPLGVRALAGPSLASALAAGALGLAGYLTGAYHLRKALALDAFLTLRKNT